MICLSEPEKEAHMKTKTMKRTRFADPDMETMRQKLNEMVLKARRQPMARPGFTGCKARSRERSSFWLRIVPLRG